jgi:hypothetical protein
LPIAVERRILSRRLRADGRTLVASSGGVLADKLGWAPFFMAVLVWIARRHAI